MQVGDTLRAVVFGIQPFGIFLRDVNHPKIDILVKVTEVSWGKDISPQDFTQMGAVLEVKIFHIDGNSALATLVENA